MPLCDMRNAFIILFCLIPGLCNSQDVLINKSGAQWYVRIIKEYYDSIHFSYFLDSAGTLHNINKKYIDHILHEKEYQVMPLDNRTGLITYTGVAEISGKPAGELYERGREWLVKTFSSSAIVFEVDNPAEGKISVKASIVYIYSNTLTHPPGGMINFTFSMFFKDGKYKYTISDFVHTGAGSIPGVGPLEQVEPPKKDRIHEIWVFNNNWNKLKRYTDSKMKDLTETLRKSMAGSSKNESW